jgi:hypothetical protein
MLVVEREKIEFSPAWQTLTASVSYFCSCDRVEWVEERRFWTFEGLLTLIGLVSGLAVFIRQKQLDHRMYQRIQKQIAAGV